MKGRKERHLGTNTNPRLSLSSSVARNTNSRIVIQISSGNSLNLDQLIEKTTFGTRRRKVRKKERRKKGKGKGEKKTGARNSQSQ